jgi:hypothetical protein
MNADELTEKLLAAGATRGEVLRRLGVIRDFLEQQFFKPDPVTLTQFVAKRNIDGDPQILQALGDDFYASFTRDTVYQLLETINKTVTQLPAVKVYLPYQPDTAGMAKLGDWFKTNVNSRVLLDIQVDPTMVGGLAVVAGGMWRDYSLRYWMKKKQNEIVEAVGKYVDTKC